MIRKIITDEKQNKLEITEIENGALIELTLDDEIDFQHYSFINLNLDDINFLISELKTIEKNLKK
jgi:hypothetical protein